MTEGRSRMLIGAPREIKQDEYRVGLTPALARELVANGHEVVVQAERLRELDDSFGGRVRTCFASNLEIERHLSKVDLVIGAVLVKGARAPHVVSRAQLAAMKERAVMVDVSIDRGGCFETSRPTPHSDPTYEVDGIVHYCVANMPGAVPITSTRALTNATMPHVLRLADLGVAATLAADPGLADGLNVVAGRLANEAVARSQGRELTPLGDAIQLIGAGAVVA